MILKVVVMMAQCSAHAQLSCVYVMSRVTCDHVLGPLKKKIKKWAWEDKTRLWLGPPRVRDWDVGIFLSGWLMQGSEFAK